MAISTIAKRAMDGMDISKARRAGQARTSSRGSGGSAYGGRLRRNSSLNSSMNTSSSRKMREGSSSDLAPGSFMQQASRNYRGNIANENGMKSMGNVTGGNIAGAIASDMGRGAVGGAAIGGTMEAANGGSFWEGAQSGAMNGAMAWGGYKSARRATNDKAIVPGAMQMQRNATGQSMSKSVRTLMQTGKDSNVARDLM